jgi:hypothetical protein
MALIDQDIAQPQIAVDHARRAWRRKVGAQPGKAERDHRAVAAGFFELRGQSFHAFGRIEPGQEAKRRGVEPVNRGQRARDLVYQPVRRLGENVRRAGGAGQAAHDEADAETVFRCQLGDDFRRGHTAGGAWRTSAASPFMCSARGEPFRRRRAAQHDRSSPCGPRSRTASFPCWRRPTGAAVKRSCRPAPPAP